MGSLEFDAAVGLDEASGDRVSPALAASPHPSAVECVDAIDPVFKEGGGGSPFSFLGIQPQTLSMKFISGK